MTAPGSALPHAATALRDAPLEEKVRTQVEFYLSDSNLPRDKFLRSRTDADPDGYVDLELLATFKRMRQLTADVSVIARALEPSDIVELSPDRRRVKRRFPLPVEDTSKARSLYLKGYKAGENVAEPTIESIVEFFQPFGRAVSVRMRRKKLPRRQKQQGAGGAAADRAKAAHNADEHEHSAQPSAEEKAQEQRDEEEKQGGGGDDFGASVPESERREQRGEGADDSDASSDEDDEDEEREREEQHEQGGSRSGAGEQLAGSGDRPRRVFKGSVFVEFDCEEAVQKVLAAHAETPLRLENAAKDLVIESKNDYLKRKRKELRERRKDRKQRPARDDDGKGAAPDKGQKRKAVDDAGGAKHEHEKRAKSQAAHRPRRGNEAAASHSDSESSNEDDGEDEDEDEEGSASEHTFETGLVLKLDNVGASCDREEVKHKLSPFGEIGWVDYMRGAPSGYVRFEEAGAAAKAVEANGSAGIDLGGQTADMLVLEGEPERAYWEKLWAAQDEIKRQMQKKKERAAKHQKFAQKKKKYLRRKPAKRT